MFDFAILGVIAAGSLIIGFYISLVLHELGHLFCGRLSGYKFVSFRLGKWLWAKTPNGKIKLVKGTGLGGTLGQCLMKPCEDEKDFHFILYNLGGIFVNLITGAVCLALFFFVDNKFIRLSFYGISISAFYLGLVSLIPSKKGYIPNDGTNVKEALQSVEAKRGLYLVFKVNADQSKGKLLSDYDECTFAVSENNADIDNFFVANTIELRSNQLEEQEAYEQSYNELLRLEPSKLPSYYGGTVILELMFHELVYFNDEPYMQRARERIKEKDKDKLFQKLITTEHPAFIPFNAAKKGLLDNDAEKAQELIVHARKLIHTLQNPGKEHYITLMLNKLELRLQAH